MRHAILALAALGLHACADSKSFSSTERTQVQPKKEADVKVEEKQLPVPMPAPMPQEIEAEVAVMPPVSVPERCESSILKVVEQKLSFPERRGCSFGKNGNLPAIDGQLQAVETQTLQLELPKGLLCDVAIQSPTDDAQLHYDDVMVLTLDNHVLLSSTDNVTNLLEAKDGVYAWDFSKVSGRRFNFDSQPYCLNSAADACVLPVTDTSGPVRIQLDAASIAPISGAIEGKISVPVSLHMLGDNDERDCYHTQLDFVLSLKYLASP